MADPISGSALGPLGNIGGTAGKKIQEQLQEHNVVDANVRGTRLAEQVQEENKRQLEAGLIDPETAARHAEDAWCHGCVERWIRLADATGRYGQGIVDTQDKSKHNLSAMRQARKNEKGLEEIQGELAKVDAKVRHSQNEAKADQVIASTNGNHD